MERKIVVLVVFVMASVIFMPSALCAETWKVDLNITSENAADMATFGIDQNATDGFDIELDDFQAPIPPTPPYVRAYFYYPDNSKPWERELATSYIAPRDSLNWSLQIEYAGSGSSNITITWDSTEISNYTILLHAQNEDIINMSEYGLYTFTAEPQTYTFNITATHITIVPTATPTPADSVSPTTTATPSITPSTTINQTPTQNITTPTPTPTPTPTEGITIPPGETPTPTPTEEAQPSKIPGFEYMSVIMGLLIVVLVMKRRRNL